MAIINGTAGHDILNGSILSDEIYGLGGNDQLFGDRGNDSLFGGAGNDTLRGDVGEDLLDGGTGTDNMNGGDGEDYYIVDNVGDVAQESFDDTDSGLRDTVQSSVTYTLGFGIEHLLLRGIAAINGTGNADNNNIAGNDARNVLTGGDGNDHLWGFDGNDLLDGGAMADVMDGGEGNDTYIVGQADDIVEELFSGGVDTVKASVTDILGEGIENLILTGSAAIGGAGNEGRNVITGNSAGNELFGQDGNDHIYGGDGTDLLHGGNGNDLLVGETGADTLTGDSGTDIFRYKSVNDTPSGSGRDTITDFAGAGIAVGDKIDLSAIDANPLVTGNQAFAYIGNATFTAPGQLRYNGDILSGNTDADTASEFQIQLVGAPALVIGGVGTDVLL